MLFVLFTLGFVVVVTGCLILINRWMVSKRPPVELDDGPQDEP